MEEEKVLLEEKGIIITDKRAIFGVKTYFIKDIKSVKRILVEHDEATKRKVRAMWLFGVMGIFCFLLDFFQNPSHGDLRLWFLFGIFFILIATGIFNLGDIGLHFIVQISDNVGVHVAYKSKDVALIDKIVKVMNQAITQRWKVNLDKRDTNLYD